MEKVVVSLVAAQHVLWHYGDEHLGVQPGAFLTHLLRALAVADLDNRARLALGFDEYVRPVAMWRSGPEGVDELRFAVKAALAAGSDEVAL